MKGHNIDKLYKNYKLIISCIGGLILVEALSIIFSGPFEYKWAVLIIVSLFISRLTVLRATSSVDVSVSDTFIFLAYLLFGSTYAIITAAALTLNESIRLSKRKLTHFFNIGLICCALKLATIIILFFFKDIKVLAYNSKLFLFYSISLICLAVVHGLMNLTLLGIAIFLRSERIDWFNWYKDNIWLIVTSLTGVVIAAVVDTLVHYYGFWAIFSTVPLLAGAYAIALPYVKNIEAARKHGEEIDNLHRRTLEAFATAVDAKDQITHEHVKRVQIYAEGMARLLNVSEDEIKALHAGALLHDIGKIAVPDYILNKPGKLTAAEFDKMKIHTVVGSQILDQIQFPYPLVPIVRFHHERWDGKGYPDGLSGENIPLTARILSIVDCFDAVREDRQYRKGMTREQAIKLLQDDRGKAFDPALVDLFVENLPTFEDQIAKARQDAQVFKPVEITETAAIREAKPAAGLAEEKKETPAFVQAIRESRQTSQSSYALYEIAESLAGQLDLNRICSLISHKIDNVVSFDPATDTCVFYWYDEECRAASVQYAFGDQSEKFQNCSIKPGEGVTGWVLANNRQFSNTDPALDLYIIGLSKDINQQFDKYSTLAVFPLGKGDETFGAMAIYSRSLESFKEEQLQRLSKVSALASEALMGAKLFLNAQKLSLTDAVTGLPNARFLQGYFDGAKRGSRTDKHPLTLLLADLGHFREVTDKVENKRVDQTIKEIAAVMQSQIRSTDTLIHYLGDKFIIVLRNTPVEMVVEVVARIQSAIIECRSILLSPDEAMLGISIGQAKMYEDGETLDKLLEIAQIRLQADRAARHSLSEALAA